MTPIEISAAKEIAEKYGYDQIVIIGRKVGDAPEGGEHVTTYGVDKKHCQVAAKMGDFLKYKIMGWKREQPLSEPEQSLKQSSFNEGVETCAQMLDDLGHKQQKVWEAYINLGQQGPATSYHTVFLNLAETLRSFKVKK